MASKVHTVEAHPEGLFSSLLLSYRGDGRWALVAPLTYWGPAETITVPQGFTTDLDSVPRLPLAYSLLHGRAIRSAVVHDWLYFIQAGRDYADTVFLQAMVDEGLPCWARWPIWWAVRRFGGAIYEHKGRATL